MRLTLAQKLLRFHWLSLLLTLGLCSAGIIFINSAVHDTSITAIRTSAEKQLIWLGIGMVIYLILSLTNYHFLLHNGLLIFIASILSLILVLIIAPEVKGARSWIPIGPMKLQPSEFSKIAFICGYSWLILQLREKIKSFTSLLILGGISTIPVGLILAQGDFGSAAVFAPITYLMLLAAGIKKRWLSIPLIAVALISLFAFEVVYKARWEGSLNDLPRATASAAVSGIPLIPESWKTSLNTIEEASPPPETSAEPEDIKPPITLLKSYQLNRISTFFDPEMDPLGAGWTIRQSLIAVGSGGLSGKGYLRGEQKSAGFLPSDISHNDFIFSVICEEFGFIGGSSLIAALGILIALTIHIAVRSKDYGGCLLCAGVVGMFFAHYFVNIGMTIKVVPITGIPLPLISYGGTFLLTCLAGLGIAQSVWIHRRDY